VIAFQHASRGPLAVLSRPPVVDLRTTIDGRRVRFTSGLDTESAHFEEALVRQLRSDGSAPQILSLWQRHAWLEASRAELRLLQVSAPDGAPAMQAALHIARPWRLPWLGYATARQLGPATSGEDEAAGLRILRQVCAASRDLLSVRVQPFRLQRRELSDFEARARRAGYTLSEPLSATRTLLMDIGAPPELLLLSLPKKTRALIRFRARAPVILREITSGRYTAACRAAEEAALRRSTGGEATSSYDFDALFRLARAHPERAVMFGLFFRDRPEELVAYACAVRHGAVAEYSSAGSLSDPRVRALPYSYMLLWELVRWAQRLGTRWLDLGGITDGGKDDALAGVTWFKRHFSDADVEIGREMVATLRPTRLRLVDSMRDILRRPSVNRPGL
jgi:hypothetical protein